MYLVLYYGLLSTPCRSSVASFDCGGSRRERRSFSASPLNVCDNRDQHHKTVSTKRILQARMQFADPCISSGVKQ